MLPLTAGEHIIGSQAMKGTMDTIRRLGGSFWLAILAPLLLANSAQGQQDPDFFNRGVALYNPEISVVADGAQIVAAPTVSADRKYVTIGTRAQLSRIIRIERFPVATGRRGVVGAPAAQRIANATPHLLDQEGIMLVRPLYDDVRPTSKGQGSP
jgi:hypothetical protein